MKRNRIFRSPVGGIAGKRMSRELTPHEHFQPEDLASIDIV